MSSLNHGYQHWTGVSTGIWQRRWTITSYGLRLCWQSRFLKVLFAVAWVGALFLMAFYFLIGQLLTPDSSLVTTITENLGKRAQSVINGLSAWILLYPEVSVDGLYRVVFSWATQLYSALAFFAVALFVPKLIAHDLASNAILIYNSKALTRFDYILGKFGIAFTLLGLLCLAPLIAVWFVGNLLSPDWGFFYHGFPALLRAVSVGLLGVTTYSLLAMAVSSLAKRTSSATAFWILAWIISGMIANTTGRFVSWGRYLSPATCLDHISRYLYDLGGVLEKAKAMLPFFQSTLDQLPRRNPLNSVPVSDGLWVPLIFLLAFWALCFFAISKRVQTE
ncbi:MAG: hypothetical protein JNN01_06840 [Opitutaceae bacterium]|nr:hypothetical protein [Opitutaceae bacterium]